MLDILQLVQLVFLLSGFVLGFLICVPIGINKQKFNSCILYAELTYDSSDKLLKFKELGQLSSCNYCIYVGVAGIVLALVLFIVGCVILYNSRDASTNEERSKIGSLILLILCGAMAFFSFVAACIISVGFSSFCKTVTKYLKTCKQLDYVAWITRTSSNAETRKFYSNFTIAQMTGIYLRGTEEMVSQLQESMEREEREECLHPWNEVGQAVRPLPPKSLNILLCAWIGTGVWLVLFGLSFFRFWQARKGRKGSDDKEPAVITSNYDQNIPETKPMA